MQAVSGPVLVRIPTERPWARSRALYWLRLLLLIVGVGGLGYYGYTVADQYVYEAYQNWAFDQQIAGRAHATFGDWVNERVLGRTPTAAAVKPAPAPVATEPRPALGQLIGRVEVPRLNLSAIVREGVDSHVLSEAVGHVPSTSMPGQPGNVAIAAHRDTLFRALKDIQEGDVVTLQTAKAQYSYEVFHTRIVKPSDVSVLRPDGGLPLTTVSNRPASMLTMITCYPFYYVGSAPERFIVQAKLISSEPASRRIEAENTSPTRPVPVSTSQHTHTIRRTEYRRPRTQPVTRKHGFWHKLLHGT